MNPKCLVARTTFDRVLASSGTWPWREELFDLSAIRFTCSPLPSLHLTYLFSTRCSPCPSLQGLAEAAFGLAYIFLRLGSPI
jgi:hypothetical protein